MSDDTVYEWKKKYYQMTKIAILSGTIGLVMGACATEISHNCNDPKRQRSIQKDTIKHLKVNS